MCVAVLSYKRTAELWGRTSKTGIQKITRKPCASFLLLSFHDDFLLHTPWLFLFFLWGVSLTVPCCFTWGVSLGLTHPVLVYVGSTSCMHLCWFIWGVSRTCPVLVYMGSFSYMPSAGLHVEFPLHIFLLGVSLLRSMLASLSVYVGNFFFTKQKEKM